MLTHWRANNDQYLSIIHNTRGKYYAVVNDAFLNQDTFEPEVEGTRLMLRCTFNELKRVCTYYQNTQTEMSL